MIDDIVDSAGTLCNAAVALMDNGADEVYSYVVHGVLSGSAVDRVEKSPIVKPITTDSIMASEEALKSDSFEQLTIALLGEAILRICRRSINLCTVQNSNIS